MQKIIKVFMVTLFTVLFCACADSSLCDSMKEAAIIRIHKQSIFVNNCQVSLAKHPLFAISKKYNQDSSRPTLNNILLDSQVKRIKLKLPGSMFYINFMRLYWNIQLSNVNVVNLYIDNHRIGEYRILATTSPSVNLYFGKLKSIQHGEYRLKPIQYRAELGMKLSMVKEDLQRLDGSNLVFSYYDVF